MEREIAIDFELWMRIIFKTCKQKITYDRYISRYLFKMMRPQYIDRKYGYGKLGEKQFYNTFYICIYFGDYDIIREYWNNMKKDEKKKWTEAPHTIPYLKYFFMSRYNSSSGKRHEFFENSCKKCCYYCDLLLFLNVNR